MKVFIIFFMVVFDLSAGFQGELKDTEGNDRILEELRGERLTVIDFWTTWCAPCKRTLPILNKMAMQYRDKGVCFIGINLDGPGNISKVAPFIKAMNISYPVLLDMNHEWASYFLVSAVPTLIVLDDSGSVVWTHEGFVTGDDVLVKEKLDSLLSNGKDR